MSKKRGMSKQQRLYYEYQNKERVKQELAEFVKQSKEIQDKTLSVSTFNPHQSSYFQ